MKYAALATIGLGLALASAPARGQAPKGEAEPKTMDQKMAYALGLNFGRGIKQSGLEVDPALIAQGIRDGLADKAALSDEQLAEVMQAIKQQLMARNAEMTNKPAGGAAASPDAARNLKAGQAFLAENKTKPGVITLPSGVQYKVIKEGTGRIPTLDDTVKAHYRGTLVNGTQFDSSYDRGEASEFPVGGVIKGWTEILQKMKVGSKYQVFIPSDMAYGPAQRNAVIGPNSTLIFDIELLDVK